MQYINRHIRNYQHTDTQTHRHESRDRWRAQEFPFPVVNFPSLEVLHKMYRRNRAQVYTETCTIFFPFEHRDFPSLWSISRAVKAELVTCIQNYNFSCMHTIFIFFPSSFYTSPWLLGTCTLLFCTVQAEDIDFPSLEFLHKVFIENRAKYYNMSNPTPPPSLQLVIPYKSM